MQLKLFIGLGNPGREYVHTYHNVGHSFIDFLNAKRCALRDLLKSPVYMNESGRFVVQELKREGVKPEELLTIHDDSDLELGEFKLSFGRGSAGHKGVQSIIDALKTKNFWRLRIGVRNAGGLVRRSPNEALLRQRLRRAKAGDFVLKKIAKSDAAVLERVFSQALAKISEFLTEK